MKKFTYVFKSADPAFLGWEWELTDLMYDWLKPRFHATRPGPDHVVNIIQPKPEGWPAHEKRFDWDYSRMDLDDLAVIIATMDEHSLRRDVLPHDVAQEVLECLGRIYQERIAQRSKLDAVLQKMRSDLQDVVIPAHVTALINDYWIDRSKSDSAINAVRGLAQEASAIQRDVNRLASVPKLSGAVTEALAALKGLGYYDPDSPAYESMKAAVTAACILEDYSKVADSVKLTGVDAALKAQVDINPWIKEFKNVEATVKERADATIKAVLDANPALKALVNSDVGTFNTAIQAVFDTHPGLQDIITHGVPAFDASKITRFDQCPHCGREL